jgi:DNA-binding phage protein
MKKPTATVSHQPQLIELLRANPKVARGSEKAGVPLQGLYRTLSAQGGARLGLLLAVLKATGFRLSREDRNGREI